MARMKKQRTQNLTQGPIVSGVVKFALPLLLTSLIQQLYATVDLLFCGNILGTQATAALGISALLITCLVGLMNGLSIGVNVVVAQLHGAKRHKAVLLVIRTVLIFSLITGVLLVLIGYALAPIYIEAMKTPSSVVSDALSYLQIYLIAMLAIMLYNMAAGICRGLGDSWTPLKAQIVGGIGNIAANWGALCVLDLGIVGIAGATLVSNGIAAFIVLREVRQPHEDRATSALRSARFSVSALVSVLRIGLPVAAQSVAITLSNIFVQHQVDFLNVDAIAAFTTYLRVELPIYYCILAIGQTTTTFVAQNHGAHDHERSTRGIAVCQGLGIGVSLALSMLLLLIGYWAFWIFSQNEAVIAYGQQLIAVTFPFYFIYAILEVQGDAIRGYGKSLGPALITLVNLCMVRTILLYVLSWQCVDVFSIAITYPITWAITAVCMVVYRIILELKFGHKLF